MQNAGMLGLQVMKEWMCLMTEYITKQQAEEAIDDTTIELYHSEYKELSDAIKRIPAANVISRDYLNQLKWELSVAIEQLHSIGLEFAEKTDDIVHIVRCGDCINYDDRVSECRQWGENHNTIGGKCWVGKNEFCYRGKRKENT